MHILDSLKLVEVDRIFKVLVEAKSLKIYVGGRDGGGQACGEGEGIGAPKGRGRYRCGR